MITTIKTYCNLCHQFHKYDAVQRKKCFEKILDKIDGLEPRYDFDSMYGRQHTISNVSDKVILKEFSLNTFLENASRK
jgi:hypothetical protein